MKRINQKIWINIGYGIVILFVAAASFLSMYYSDRMVFGNNLRFISSFFSLVLCLTIAVAVRQPVVSLVVALIPTICLWEYDPMFGGVLFPVALQAVLYDGANSVKKRDAVAFYAAAVLDLASIGLHIRAATIEKRTRLHLQGFMNPPAEKYVYMVFLFLLFFYYCKTFSGGFRRGAAGNKTRRGAREEQPIGDRLHTVHLFCIINTVSAGVYCVLFFDSLHVKVVVLGQLLFLLFLLFRQKVDLGIKRESKRKDSPEKRHNRPNVS